MKENVVITYNFDSYDSIKDPVSLTPNWDYIAFADKELRSKIWSYFDIPGALKKIKDPKRKASFLKIVAHKFVNPNYKKVITVDGSMRINCNLDDFLKIYNKNNDDFTIARHPKRTCLYEEAREVLRLQFDQKEIVDNQINRYKLEGFPKNIGLYGTRVMIKNNHSANLNSFFDLWGEEYLKGSKRDQISMTYALWKYNKNNSKKVKVNSFNFKEVYLDKKFFEITPHFKSRKIKFKTL